MLLVTYRLPKSVTGFLPALLGQQFPQHDVDDQGINTSFLIHTEKNWWMREINRLIFHLNHLK
jgi:hypothetical protein